MNARTKRDDAAPAFVGTAANLIDADKVDALLRIAVDASPRELLAAATRVVTDLLGQRGSCILVDGGAPRVAFALHAPGLVDWPVDLTRYPEVVAAVETGDVVTIDDVRSDARLDRVRSKLPLELGSVAAVPLMVGDRCLGAFLVQSSVTQIASEESKSTAALIAKIAALVLARSAPLLSGVVETTVANRPSGPMAVVDLDPGPVAPDRILIIDDDDAFASVLASSLTDEGYEVERTNNGADGLRRAAEARPDLVLLDVNLPSLNGFDIARLLRNTPVHGNVPILFLSGADDLAVRVRGIRLSDVDFLPKPFSIDELLTRIQRARDGATARRKLLLQAEHDELTGLGNLRLLRSRMVAERARFERYGSALSLAIFDVDKLKQLNDQHGHVAGSRALKAIADVLRKEIRETDLAIRYGGDEFVVLLPHTTLAEGLAFAHRAVAHIAEIRPGGVSVSVSVGIAALGPKPKGETGTTSDDDLLRRADAAAYRAKRLGGNRVCADGDDLPAG